MMTRNRAIALLLCTAALAGCEKNAVQDITGPMASARIKFYNFGVNAPGVNFYANDTKMTAISSATGTESTTGINSGGVSAGDRYSTIAPGQYTISGRIAAATDKDLPISSVAASIADGRTYSYFISGIYNTTTKTADAFIIEDVFPAAIDWSQAKVRFVHAISNANPMVLHLRNTVTNEQLVVGGPVAYKAGGGFVDVPNGVYELTTRYEGSTTNAIVRPTNVTFAAGRVYTVGARGDITVPGTTSPARPQLDVTTNQ
jgi:hypothetical protein